LSISEQESPDSFIAEFLEDYFSESEEHLTAVRSDLLALERFVNQAQINRPLLDGLFRSFHSLKGISGMVGVREAEQLAHHMESYLRILRQEQVSLSQQGIDNLIASTKLLEQVISAKRQKQAPPDITAAVARLEELVGNPPPPESFALQGNPLPAPVEVAAPGQQSAAAEDGAKLWRFEFIPTPELAQRGININFIRARLQEAGELRSGAPRVLQGGGIAFEFILASQVGETGFTELRQCGLTYEVMQAPEPAISAAATTEPAGHNNQQTAPIVASANVVRVNLSRLDELMRMVGELVISRSRLQERLQQAESEMPVTHWRPLQETNLIIERQIRDLREGIMRVRMVPVGEIFERMRFIIRDLSREHQKQIQLEVSGQETEIDKLLIERLIDPLMHLVRNAISHGLESAEERVAAGKAPLGTIALRAFTSAETVVIEVEDDGRGIDRQQVGKRAYQMGLVAENPTLSDELLLDLICSPGFSTRDQADRTSGRGVGMGVVQNMLLGLGGSFALDTEIGRGTRFRMQLPITVAIAEALIVTAGGQKFAVPQSAVREVLAVESGSIKAFENNEIIAYRGGVLPLIRLARLFGFSENQPQALHTFVIGNGGNAFGIAVDRILGQREIVVRALNDPLLQIAGFAGATELGDGQLVLVLDAAALGKQAAYEHRIN
jgi:two-component system, chemotaxis family, sensor kinase CheA